MGLGGGGGAEVKFCHNKKGWGADKVLAMLEGGGAKRGSFNMGLHIFAHFAQGVRYVKV